MVCSFDVFCALVNSLLWLLLTWFFFFDFFLKRVNALLLCECSFSSLCLGVLVFIKYRTTAVNDAELQQEANICFQLSASDLWPRTAEASYMTNPLKEYLVVALSSQTSLNQMINEMEWLMVWQDWTYCRNLILSIFTLLKATCGIMFVTVILIYK